MIRRLLLRRLDAEEKKLGASLDYVRHVVRTSLGAFFKFALFLPLAKHRKRLPADAWSVARLVAVRDEDCGTCVQIELDEARRAGVPRQVLVAAIEDRLGDLSPELALVHRFARAVVEASGEEDELRPAVRERYGEEGLVELALAIASARVFPVTKRALGYATSCSRVTLDV